MAVHPACPLILASLALAAAISTGCGPATEAVPARVESPGEAAAVSVAIAKPEWTTIRRTTEQPGQVEAFEVTPIHAKIAGYVRAVNVDIGDRITKGQVLAELSEPEMEAELGQKRALVEQAGAEKAQAEAAVEVAEAGVASATAKVAEVRSAIRRTEADVARWQAELARVEQLLSESAVTGSLRDETRSKLASARAARDETGAKVDSADAALVEAKALLDKARSDVVAADARVEVARAEARRVEALLGYAKIEAPFEGIVTRRQVDTGRLTAPGTDGEPLFVVARTERVTISVGVPEAEAPLVNRGDPARVRLQALGGPAIEGTVTRTSWSLDAATRTLRAEIDLPNPDDRLQPGLYAYVAIDTAEHPDVLTVPASAIVREGGRAFVVIAEGGQARRSEVEPGLSDGTRIEVRFGLSGGEAVVISGADALTDGQAIQAHEAAGDAAKP